MTKTMKIEGPLHVICQCDKCKPQISFNAEVIGYVEPQRQWVGLEIEEVQDSYNSDYQAQTRAVEKILKERNT